MMQHDLAQSIDAGRTPFMEESGAELPRYLTFFVKDVEYAVPLECLREIVSLEALTRVPCTPSWLLGVSNLRGDVLPIIDLAVRLGGKSSERTARTCYVVIDATLRGETIGVGLMLDAVGRIASETPGACRHEAVGGGHQSRFIQEVLVLEDDAVFLLNMLGILDERDLVAAGLIRPREGVMSVDPDALPSNEELADGGIHLF